MGYRYNEKEGKKLCYRASQATSLQAQPASGSPNGASQPIKPIAQEETKR